LDQNLYIIGVPKGIRTLACSKPADVLYFRIISGLAIQDRLQSPIHWRGRNGTSGSRTRHPRTVPSVVQTDPCIPVPARCSGVSAAHNRPERTAVLQIGIISAGFALRRTRGCAFGVLLRTGMCRPVWCEQLHDLFVEKDQPGVKALCPGQVPALIAKFESTGTPVPLQCHPEVVRPNGHAELPG
jgi:hypothetical protein